MTGDRFYLTVNTMWDGRILAVVSKGHPERGDKKILICTVKTFAPPIDAARPLAEVWFKKMLQERPWETRQ